MSKVYVLIRDNKDDYDDRPTVCGVFDDKNKLTEWAEECLDETQEGRGCITEKISLLRNTKPQLESVQKKNTNCLIKMKGK